MSERTTNGILGLLRKSVGLPPAKGGCCGAPASKETEPNQECCEPVVPAGDRE